MRVTLNTLRSEVNIVLWPIKKYIPYIRCKRHQRNIASKYIDTRKRKTAYLRKIGKIDICVVVINVKKKEVHYTCCSVVGICMRVSFYARMKLTVRENIACLAALCPNIWFMKHIRRLKARLMWLSAVAHVWFPAMEKMFPEHATSALKWDKLRKWEHSISLLNLSHIKEKCLRERYSSDKYKAK